MRALRKSKRNSIFELLRLLAMFMIVMEHCLLSTALHTGNPLSGIDNIGWLVEAFTVCAVDIFLLLTGYFIKSKSLKLGRIFELWLKTVFYSVFIYLIAVLTGADSFKISDLISYFCPILTKKYWFMQTYIVLALLVPYIATLLDHLSMKRHLILIAILLIFFSAHQTFIPVGKTLDATQGYGIIWACVLLITGCFLRKYGDRFIDKVSGSFFLSGYLFIACGIWVTNYLIVKFDIAQGVTSRGNFYAYNSSSVFLESICLFCFFIKLSKKKYNWGSINWLSSSVLSVYLLSSHPELLYPLWTDVFKMDRFITAPIVYVGLTIICVLVTMLICILLDKVVDRLSKLIHIDNVIKDLNNSRLNKVIDEI